MFVTDRANKLWTLAITCIGFFMVLLDASIVTVALPTMQTNLHANLSGLQWVIDAYTLPFAVLLLTAGTLSDRFGRKRVFLVGLMVFTFGSAICGFAPDLGWLIAGRILQGIGGAALSPGSLSVLAAAFTDPRERTQAIGIWSSISGVGLAAGPLLGGVLIQVAGWQAIFFVNLPVGIFAGIVGLRRLAESRNPTAHRLDILGQVLVVGALTALAYALIEGNSLGWRSPLIIALFIATTILLFIFIVTEARTAEPLLPLTFFRNTIFSAANSAALVVGFALLGTVFFISQYFQEVQGYSALDSGIHTLPTTLGIFLAAPVAATLTARFGPRLPVTLGALCAGTALLLLTRLGATTSYGALWWNFALFGIGIGLTLSPLTVAIMGVTPPESAGIASSIISTSRQIGGVFGVALLGALVQNQFSRNIAINLIARHVPALASNAIASSIASAGAQASHINAGHQLPVTQATLHMIIGQSFSSAIHVAFVVGGVALLGIAIVAFALLDRKSHAQLTADEEVEALAQDASSVGAEIG